MSIFFRTITSISIFQLASAQTVERENSPECAEIWSHPTGCFNGGVSSGRPRCSPAECSDSSWLETSAAAFYTTMTTCAVEATSSMDVLSRVSTGFICSLGGFLKTGSHKGNIVEIHAIKWCDGTLKLTNYYYLSDVPPQRDNAAIIAEGYENDPSHRLHEWGCHTTENDPWTVINFTRNYHDHTGGLTLQTQSGGTCTVGGERGGTGVARAVGQCGECWAPVTFDLGAGLTGVTVRGNGGSHGVYFHNCEAAGAPAVSAGDPHILRFDGTAFDIDATGSYSLFNVAGGGQFSVKSTVAHEKRPTKSNGKYNMECEFGGSWLGGHNVTAVAAGGEDGLEAGIYFDGHFVSIPNLLQNTSQYTREFTGHSKMILERCQVADNMSDYCISSIRLRNQNRGVKSNAYMTMVTDAANITIRYSTITYGHLDIYTTLQQGADSTQIGGLLAGGRLGTRRGASPLLASSVGAVRGDVGGLGAGIEG